MADSSQKELKALWEKEKLFVTSNFPFSHSVFYRHVKKKKKKGLFGLMIVFVGKVARIL